nr:hypothetical protein [uncultured bacterium]
MHYHKKKKGQHECRPFFKQQKLIVKFLNFLFKNCDALFQTYFTLVSFYQVFFCNTINLRLIISLYCIEE